MSAVAAERRENAQMIAQSAAAVADEADLGRVRSSRFTEAGFDRVVWTVMGDMGWLALRLPESVGGSDLGMVEYCALTRALGRGLAPEPLIEGVLAARLLDGEELQALIAGRTVVMPAWPDEPMTLAGGQLSGIAHRAPMAGGADLFVIPDADGAYVVKADSIGLSVEKTQDGGNLGTLVLRDVPARHVAGDAEFAVREAALATSAYLLGVMERAFEITLEYLRTRHQFGRAIGSFQALQHKAADLKLQLALTDASVNAAAEAWDDGKPTEAVRAAVSRAKVRAAESAMRVTREAIQLHGAIGYTDEADISLFVRKAMCLANRYGSPAEHRARQAAFNITSGGSAL